MVKLFRDTPPHLDLLVDTIADYKPSSTETNISGSVIFQNAFMRRIYRQGKQERKPDYFTFFPYSSDKRSIHFLQNKHAGFIVQLEDSNYGLCSPHFELDILALDDSLESLHFSKEAVEILYHLQDRNGDITLQRALNDIATIVNTSIFYDYDTLIEYYRKNLEENFPDKATRKNKWKQFNLEYPREKFPLEYTDNLRRDICTGAGALIRTAISTSLKVEGMYYSKIDAEHKNILKHDTTLVFMGPNTPQSGKWIVLNSCFPPIGYNGVVFKKNLKELGYPYT